MTEDTRSGQEDPLTLTGVLRALVELIDGDRVLIHQNERDPLNSKPVQATYQSGRWSLIFSKRG